MGNYFRGLNAYGTYGERDGKNGRVGKKEFSIDGRSWNYRDPRNQRMIDSFNQNREKGKIKYNPKSNPKYDALYDYDFGTVRDAAKVLGISNVNKKREDNNNNNSNSGERNKMGRVRRERDSKPKATLVVNSNVFE